MLCPSCKESDLRYTQLESNLPCQTCSNCGGNWLVLTDYLQWEVQFSEQELREMKEIRFEVEPQDSKHALLCPVSGVLMHKYRISSNTTHRLI